MSRYFNIPNTLVLLFSIMIVALILTWIVPAGEFDTEINEAGRSVVVPGTYSVNTDRTYLSPLALFTVIPRALGDASGIIFFVLIIGGSLAVIRETGAIDAMLARIITTIGHMPSLLIFFGMFAFAAASATLGMAEEYIPFAIILVGVCAALRMDTVSAIGIMVVGYGIGYGVALMNPFTLFVAQGVAELQPGSGMEYRAIISLPFLLIGFHHVWSYTRKVRQRPESSLVFGISSAQPPVERNLPELTRTHIAVLIATGAALTGLVLGIALAEWYLVELGAMFVSLAIAAGLIARMGTDTIAVVFTKGAAELTGTALLIGFARSIALLLEDGEVLHTIVNAAAAPLSYAGAEFAAVGMLFIQSILNFFIPSGSGQAFVTMPLMAPIGDLAGVSRQVSVLAFQFGDGFMNMIVPTNPVLMGILGLAGIPYDRWFRFILPLILKLFVAGSLALIIAVWIGYQ
jgi:uncharacterized ion transporter superfamily protein YfcC